MTSRQARIFVPSTDALEGWLETLLGTVVKPVVSKYSAQIEWFWFSRNCSPIQGPAADLGDCDFSALPPNFKRPLDAAGPGMQRSMRFRYKLHLESTPQFEQDFTTLLSNHGYGCSGCLDYDFVEDLGGDRFTSTEHRPGNGRGERAQLVVHALMAVSRIVLHSLVGPDPAGRYGTETNDSAENPEGSSFESLHHMVCNITSPPLSATLCQDPSGAQLFLGTAWSPPPTGMAPIAKLPLRF